jgi:dolichyl-phosphate beta-glucosyltransferase
MIDEKTPQISIVIPSYNEEHRLPKFLDEVVRFTSESRKKYEIIVVDDGSTDQTRPEKWPFRFLLETKD